jgi:hypothetical protein
MTTFNPSHNPFRKPQGRHAQAVHRPSPEPSDVDSDDEHEPGSSSFPDDLPSNESDSESGEEHQRARRQGRGRVKASIPPLPDLRFEQVSLPPRPIPPADYRWSLVVLVVDSPVFATSTNKSGCSGEGKRPIWERRFELACGECARGRGLPLGSRCGCELADGSVYHPPRSGALDRPCMSL